MKACVSSQVSFLRPRKSGIGLDMTPMIDIVFQLLIFFMLSSSFLNPSLKLTLPKAVQQDAREPAQIIVNVDKSGSVYINQRKVEKNDLRAGLETLLAVDEKKAVHLRGDTEMPYGFFVEVMDLAKQAGARQINIVHEPRDGEATRS